MTSKRENPFDELGGIDNADDDSDSESEVEIDTDEERVPGDSSSIDYSKYLEQRKIFLYI
jgi:hypothetical protein